jgi:hypothetical protein
VSEAYNAIVERANEIARGGESPFIYGTAYHAVCHLLHEPPDKPGLMFYDIDDQPNARLTTLAFALAVLCLTETGDMHAVLIVSDSEEGGDWILDNRHPTIYTFEEMKRIGYTGKSLQRAGHWLWEAW